MGKEWIIKHQRHHALKLLCCVNAYLLFCAEPKLENLFAWVPEEKIAMWCTACNGILNNEIVTTMKTQSIFATTKLHLFP